MTSTPSSPLLLTNRLASQCNEPQILNNGFRRVVLLVQIRVMTMLSIFEKCTLVGSLTHANKDGYRFACISHIIQSQSLKEPTTQE